MLRRAAVVSMVVGLTMAACSGDGEPAPGADEPPTDTVPPDDTDARAPADPTEALPAATLAIVRQASQVMVGTLRIVSADEAEAQSLASRDRIAGYPVDGSLVALPSAQSAELQTQLLDPGSYAVPQGERCRNETMFGARFIRGEEVVELALGVECRQAIWSYPRPDEPGRWGGMLGQETTARVLPLFSPEPDR